MTTAPVKPSRVMERTVEVTFQLPAAEVCIDIDVKTGVSLAKLAQLAGTPVTGVMFKI